MGFHWLELPPHDRQEASVENCEGDTWKEIQKGQIPPMDSPPFLICQTNSSKNVMKNKGSKTGVDGIIIKTPAQKLALAKSMKRRGYQPSPLRHIYIPKKGNKKKLRPLGIPTITDRCQQALHALSLIPISEVTADLNSYGFRPQRCCADAIEQTFIVLSRRDSPQWFVWRYRCNSIRGFRNWRCQANFRQYMLTLLLLKIQG